MEVVQLHAFHQKFTPAADFKAFHTLPELLKDRLQKALVLNNSASLYRKDNGTFAFKGNPTDGALLLFAQKCLIGADIEGVRKTCGYDNPVARRPFTRATLSQATIVKPEPGCDFPRLYVTGAPERILPKVKFITTVTANESGAYRVVKSAELGSNLRLNFEAMAAQGLRVLAVAYRDLDDGSMSGSAAEKLTAEQKRALLAKSDDEELTLLGLFGIADPLRDGVADAVRRIHDAGVRVIMVTGDNQDTAKTIATSAGILASDDRKWQQFGRVMTGEQYRSIEDSEQRHEALKTLGVLARCRPEDKVLLVKDLQETGEVVSVTGDGTNDAPALRQADIGLAMGIAGTDVAKEAASIEIMDDNFVSITKTIRWGRSIKENIRKFLTFQLTINIVALTLTFVSACASGGNDDAGGLSDLPLKPVQLCVGPATGATCACPRTHSPTHPPTHPPLRSLWVNLIMDTFAALALATEPPGERLMDQPPQGRSEPLITPIMYKNMIGHALWQMAVLLWMTRVPSSLSWWGLPINESVLGSAEHDTIVFNTFVVMQIFNIFNCRSVHDEFNIFEDFHRSIVAQVRPLCTPDTRAPTLHLTPAPLSPGLRSSSFLSSSSCSI